MMQHPKWAAVSAAFAVATAVHAQVTFYVDDDAPAGGDGLSWYSAFSDLQDALDVARLLRTDVNVHIAQGVYTPDRGTGHRGFSFDIGDEDNLGPASSFVLQIQGGFAGLGSPQPDEHDPRAFVTVLSGDLLGNDTDDPESRGDNAYHVITMQAGSSRPARLISLTVRGGQADGEFAGDQVGAGARLAGNSPFMELSVTFSNCIITDCHAAREGGGIDADLYWLILANTTIERCTAERGGAIDAEDADEIFMNYGCTIADCSAQTGGAIFLASHVTLVAHRSIFAGNSAVTGGAIAARGLVGIDGCLFAQNSADIGGAVHTSGTSYTVLMRSTSLIDNRATAGSAIWTRSDADILGCIIAGDEAAPLVSIDGRPALRFWESCVERGLDAIAGDTADVRWGVGMVETDPLLVDRAGADGDASTWRDNDYRPSNASPCIDAAPALGPLTVEGLNEPRPFNSTGSCMTIADMGCYEYLGWSHPLPPPRLYVDASAPAGGDGLSWATAFDQIQDALRVPGVQEVWVASGMYFPPRPEYGYALELSCIEPGARLLGGFAGWETDESQRDPDSNVTTISGIQHLNNDPEFPSGGFSNTVAIYVRTGRVVVDGFSIDTGGVYAFDGDVTFANSTFAGVRNSDVIRQINGVLRLQDCHLHDNETGLSTYGSLLMEGCLLENNFGTYWDDFINAGGFLDIDRTVFRANVGFQTIIDGGDVQSITNSAFIGNRLFGPLLRSREISDIINCAFADNDSDSIMYAVYEAEYLTFTNCWLWNSGTRLVHGALPTVSNCLADFSIAGFGNILAAEPGVARLPSPGPDNDWGTPDDDFGDLRPRDFSVLIDAGDSYALPDDASVLDLAAQPRLVDDPTVADTGLGFPTVDIGPYERQPASCLPDWDADGSLTFNDALTYLADYDARDERADLNTDGQFGFFDVQIFLNAFAAGCP